MNTIATGFLGEFEQEAKTTRRVLERLSDDKLDWRPHPDSMTSGQLGLHIAAAPSILMDLVQKDENPMPEFSAPSPASVAEILSIFDATLTKVREQLPKLDDARMGGSVGFVRDGKTLMAFPRGPMVRMLLLNHIIHHRGQLSVYLRGIGAKVPSIYGPSHDEGMQMG